MRAEGRGANPDIQQPRKSKGKYYSHRSKVEHESWTPGSEWECGNRGEYKEVQQVSDNDCMVQIELMCG